MTDKLEVVDVWLDTDLLNWLHDMYGDQLEETVNVILRQYMDSHRI